MKKEKYEFRVSVWLPVFAAEFGVRRAMLEASRLVICKVKGVKVSPSYITVNQSQKCLRDCKRGNINIKENKFSLLHCSSLNLPGTKVLMLFELVRRA